MIKHISPSFYHLVHVQFIILLHVQGPLYMYRIRADARRSSSRFRQSDSVYTAAGDLGLHRGLDGLFALACGANGELIERGNYGVMIEVNSTGDSSASEVQVFQFLQFRNARWNLCVMHTKSQQSSRGDGHCTNLSTKNSLRGSISAD